MTLTACVASAAFAEEAVNAFWGEFDGFRKWSLPSAKASHTRIRVVCPVCRVEACSTAESSQWIVLKSYSLQFKLTQTNGRQPARHFKHRASRPEGLPRYLEWTTSGSGSPCGAVPEQSCDAQAGSKLERLPSVSSQRATLMMGSIV